MLGPIVNPAQPKYQLVGVFSLELARLYAYLYQKSDKKYTILHTLDGYDEVSLTTDFKIFSTMGERVYSVEDLGFGKMNATSIRGGDTVQESSLIFKSVLMGEGTAEQNKVVLANAALAIKTIHSDRSFADCFSEASEALFSKRALTSFKKLVS